jgi:hypothetical protein
VSRWERVRYDDGEHVRDRETDWWLIIQGATTSGLEGRSQWEVTVYSKEGAGGEALDPRFKPVSAFSGGPDPGYDHKVVYATYDHRPRRGELAELVDSLRQGATE